MHPAEADDLDIDEVNEPHLAENCGVSAVEVLQVWMNDPVYARNKKDRTADWLMVGYTDGGRPLTVAVLTDEVRRLLRPISGRRSEPWELARYQPKRA